jgi:Carboxypeptidase regulatory-like domain
MLGSGRDWVFGLAAMVLALARSGAAEDTRVAVEIAGGDPFTRVRVTASARRGESVSGIAHLGTSRQVWLALSSSESWTIEGTAPGFWSDPVVFLRGATAPRVILWPAAAVAFDLKPPFGSKPPTSLRLRLSQPGEAAPAGTKAIQPPAAEIACPVANASVLCVVPAGEWDICAQAAGFVPHNFWKRSIDVGKTSPLGELVLQRGSALSGRVFTETAPADPLQARVEVRPLVGLNRSSSGVPKELERLMIPATISEGGYFLFDALAPGAYSLTARQPGFESQESEITIDSGVDRQLPAPIVLLRPLRLTVLVDPPLDTAQGEWQIAVMAQRRGNLRRLAAGSASREGIWQSGRLAPGPYSIQVRNRAGDALAWKDMVLARESQEFRIELDLVLVDGEIHLGDEPFAGSLWFGGQHGKERIATVSDTEGKFHVVLPHQGRWRVDVSGRGETVNVAGLEVTVKPLRANRAARVSIELPNTAIRGTVRDSAMNPVSGAAIRLLPLARPDNTTATRSDIRGEFSIEGQSPGSYSVEATSGNRSSDLARVELVEGLLPPRLDLVLADRRRFVGKVLAGNQLLEGANVLGFPTGANGGLSTTAVPQAHSGIDGTFQLDLPRDTTRVRLVVTELGFALAVTNVELAEHSGPVVVNLQQASGTVTIRPSQAKREGKSLPLILIDGQPVDFPLLLGWAQANGAVAGPDEVVSMPALPPGNYAYCEFLPDELFLVLAGAAMPASGSCSEGYLSSGGVLTLSARTSE